MAEIQDLDDQSKIRSSVELTGTKGLTAQVISSYKPPLDGRSDDYEGFDKRVAEGIGLLLNKHYFGYRWSAFSDAYQGVVGFAIPELMGPTLHMIVRLAEFKDVDQLVVDKAGELLERMGLPRGQMDMGAYLLAKQNRHKFDFGDVKSTGNR